MSWVEKGGTASNTRTFLIESASDLSSLPTCDAGSFAYTADMTTIYQMSIGGEWVQVGGETT